MELFLIGIITMLSVIDGVLGGAASVSFVAGQAVTGETYYSNVIQAGMSGDSDVNITDDDLWGYNDDITIATFTTEVSNQLGYNITGLKPGQRYFHQIKAGTYITSGVSEQQFTNELEEEFILELGDIVMTPDNVKILQKKGKEEDLCVVWWYPKAAVFYNYIWAGVEEGDTKIAPAEAPNPSHDAEYQQVKEEQEAGILCYPMASASAAEVEVDIYFYIEGVHISIINDGWFETYSGDYSVTTNLSVEVSFVLVASHEEGACLERDEEWECKVSVHVTSFGADMNHHLEYRYTVDKGGNNGAIMNIGCGVEDAQGKMDCSSYVTGLANDETYSVAFEKLCVVDTDECMDLSGDGLTVELKVSMACAAQPMGLLGSAVLMYLANIWIFGN